MNDADEILDKVRLIAADLFDEPVDAIRPETSPENLEAWDSLQHLNLMLALEESFGLSLSPEDGEHLTSIGAVAALVASRV